MAISKNGRLSETVVVKSHTLSTIKEEFDEYELENGLTLRLKQVLVTFGMTDDIQTDEKGGKFVKTVANFQLVAGVIPTKEVDTSDLKPIGDKGIPPSERGEKLGFTPKMTYTNIYETDEAVLFVNTELANVYSTPYKDKIGNPMYHVEANAILTAQPKPTKESIKAVKKSKSFENS